MKLDLRIGEIVVEGVELSPRERDALLDVVARELRELLAGAAPPSDRPQWAAAQGTQRAERIARDVALAVHRALPAPGALAAPQRAGLAGSPRAALAGPPRAWLAGPQRAAPTPPARPGPAGAPRR